MNPSQIPRLSFQRAQESMVERRLCSEFLSLTIFNLG
nr:MAG TPA: hypothetical protein [Caudoviricetes sp.]